MLATPGLIQTGCATLFAPKFSWLNKYFSSTISVLLPTSCFCRPCHRKTICIPRGLSKCPCLIPNTLGEKWHKQATMLITLVLLFRCKEALCDTFTFFFCLGLVWRWSSVSRKFQSCFTIFPFLYFRKPCSYLDELANVHGQNWTK